MKRRTLSIVSELLFIAIGVFFAVSSLMLRQTANYYESPSLYPLIVSVALIITSCVALFNDLFGKGKSDEEVFDIPNPKGLIIALAIIVAMKLIWQLFDLFYVAVLLGVWSMLFCFHDIHKEKKQRLIYATAGSVVFTVVAYVVFTLILTIRF